MTVSDTGEITLSYTGTNGGGAGNAPAIIDSWTAANRSSASILISRSARGNAGYEFSAERSGTTAVTNIYATYKPAGAPTTRSGDNQVRYTSRAASISALECGYSSDPNFSLRFTDYNARIARAMTGVTTRGASLRAFTLASGVATWSDQVLGVDVWTRLNLSTGQLATSGTQTGTYTDFSVMSAVPGSGGVQYTERVINGSPEFEIAQDSPYNLFKFSVLQGNELNVRLSSSN